MQINPSLVVSVLDVNITKAPFTDPKVALALKYGLKSAPRSSGPFGTQVHSGPTRVAISSAMERTYRTTALAPCGVEWPTVSATHSRFAPARMAVVNSFFSDSGSARVVSSVTYIVVSPSFTAKVSASSVHLRR